MRSSENPPKPSFPYRRSPSNEVELIYGFHHMVFICVTFYCVTTVCLKYDDAHSEQEFSERELYPSVRGRYVGVSTP